MCLTENKTKLRLVSHFKLKEKEAEDVYSLPEYKNIKTTARRCDAIKVLHDILHKNAG